MSDAVSYSRRVRPEHCTRIRIEWACLLLLVVPAGGCSTHAQRIRDARELFHQGELESAAVSLEKAGSVWHRDQDCLRLDRAMIALVDGRPREAEQQLREVRDQFDYLGQSNLAEASLSYLTDDKQRAYAGEDYEQVLIRVFLALASLMGDGTDAPAYALQVEAKQNEIIEQGLPGAAENPKRSYPQLAVGPYLHGILRESTHLHYDDAAQSFAKVVSWEPRFAGGPQDLGRVQQGRHSAPGHGVLYLFTLVGRGPYKQEVSETPTSEALLLADRLLSAVGKYQLPPTIAPLKVPQVVLPASTVEQVLVQVDDRPPAATQTITDIGELAAFQHQAVFPHLVARAVVRRVVKKAVAYGAQEHLGVDNQWATLGILAAGVAWEFSESADTRCWGTLPRRIQVQRFELPAGEHHLALTAARHGVPCGPPANGVVPIADGRNTYVLACFPDTRLVGKLQISQP